MQRVVFLNNSAPDNALILKSAVNVDCDLYLPTLFSHELLYPLPARIVEIMDMDARFTCVGLGAIHAHSISIVPLEVARGGFLGQIAVDIVFVAKDCGPGGQGVKAIVTGNQREVTVKAASTIRQMLQVLDVAYEIVYNSAAWANPLQRHPF